MQPKKKNIVLVGDPGGGKTVSIETLPGGTILFNMDPGGWRSLERAETKAGKKRRPKKLVHAKTLREWFGKGGRIERNEIVVVDYSEYCSPFNTGKLTSYDAKVYAEFGHDINHLELHAEEYRKRGVCHFVIDSLTGLQWYVLKGMVSLAGHADKGTSQHTYGLAIEKIREIVDVCCHIPFDFILTAHVESEKDEVVGKIQETILLYGKKLPGILLSMIDDVYYVSVTTINNEKSFYFETSPQMFLKIIRQRSFDDLPVRVKPDFSLLYEGQLCSPEGGGKEEKGGEKEGN